MCADETDRRSDGTERQRQRPSEMVRLSWGQFWMGSTDFYPEEGPSHQVIVDGFEIDLTPVTNADFAEFVADTGYVTLAESSEPDEGWAGGMVFDPAAYPEHVGDWRELWKWIPEANWRHPLGAGSDIEDKARHPVVQVAYPDAEAFAEWAGKELPSEAEWEYAARGGLDRATYTWGNDRRPANRLMANFWQGRFPTENQGANGWRGTSPVMEFPPNGFGLYDMAGNVWEWTSDFWAGRHPAQSYSPIHNPRMNDPDRSYALGAERSVPRRVLKGGSYLCAPSHSIRFRPAARCPEAIDWRTSDIGFRCIRRENAGVKTR